MNKLMFSLSLVIIASVALAASKSSQNHVPTNLDGIRMFDSKAADRNNIALINVDNAIPAADWPSVSTYAASRLNFNIWTNETSKSKIKIYFMRGQPAEGVLAAPGKWAKVDVSFLEKDNPDPQTLRDRQAKLILRSIAFGVGGGATLEPYCSMFYEAQDLKGLDKTNITLAPMCYFPMIEILRQIGGNEIVSAIEHEEAE